MGINPPRPKPRRPGIPDLPPGYTPRPAARPPASPYANDYAQAAALAKGQMDPLVAALAGQIQRQATAGIGAITGYTGQLAQSLGGQQQKAAGIWGAAQQAQAASDAALANRLSGGGAELSNELSGRLASINAPAATGQVTSNVAQTGTGAGNALYGTGSAELGNLVAQGAAAQDYASKLPGLAQLGGVQGVRDFGLQQQKLLADQSGQLLAQAPGLQNEALSYISSQRSARAASQQAAVENRQKALQQRFENIVALGYDPTTGKLTQKAQNEIQKLQLESQRLNVQAQQGQARIDIAQQGVDQRGAATAAAAQAKAAATARPNPALSRTYGIVVDSNGNPILRNGKPIPVAKGAGKGGALTAGQKANLRKQAVKEAETYYYGVPPKKHYDATSGKWINEPGSGVAGLDYPTAVRRLMAEYSMSQQEAQTILNDYYAPGEDGRPGGPKAKPKPKVNPGTQGDFAAGGAAGGGGNFGG